MRATAEIELASEAFGEPADPAVLLIMGAGASMLWWPEDLCRLIAGRGLRVIRYDHRDTGRSTTVAPGEGTYGLGDLASDALRVLDDHGVASAHLAGMSMGGMLALRLALDHPERVRSLTLIASSPGAGDDDLPGPDAIDAPSTAEDAPPADRMAEEWRVLSGCGREFDHRAAHDIAHREVARALDPASASNHYAASGGDAPIRPRLSTLGVPTAVVHGSADPVFPLAHGEALAREVPGARLVVLEGAGHEVHRDDWRAIAAAIPA